MHGRLRDTASAIARPTHRLAALHVLDRSATVGWRAQVVSEATDVRDGPRQGDAEAITVSAAASGNLGLAAGNLIGGIATQTMVLVLCDLFAPKPLKRRRLSPREFQPSARSAEHKQPAARIRPPFAAAQFSPSVHLPSA